MVDSKKEIVVDEVKKVLFENESKGITKNELILTLENRGKATRKTIYRYWKELVQDGIIEERLVGKQRKKCYPTPQNQVLVKLEDKVKIVKELLDVIEKNPLIGDCIASDKSFKNIPILTYPKISKVFQTYNADRIFDMIDTEKPSPKGYYSTTHIYSLTSRRDILKELPGFLIQYINHPNHNFNKSIKEKFLQIILPYVIRCLEILQQDYVSSFSYSDSFKNELSKVLPANTYAMVYTVKKIPSPDLILEFLKILGRYYCCILESSSSKVDKVENVLSQFIESFYKDLVVNDKLDKYLKQNQLENVVNRGTISEELIKNHSLLKKVKNSFTWKLVDPLVINSDTGVIRDIYMKFFINLGLFSNTEKRVFRKVKPILR